MNLKSDEIEILKKALQTLEGLSFPFSEKDLFQVSVLLKTLSTSEHLELQKISEIPDHFHPEMTLRHLQNFMIPMERALGRTLRDDQFVVLTKDKPVTASPKHERSPIIFILENLRSAFNVGSIFRLADCLNAQEIHLVGYTATPEQDQLKKTSLGSTETVPWRHFSTLLECIQYNESLGFTVAALETAENSVSLYEAKLPLKTSFLVGNERFGLEPKALSLASKIVRIPTLGIKNSLNVSQALSIVSYEWLRQNPQ